MSGGRRRGRRGHAGQFINWWKDGGGDRESVGETIGGGGTAAQAGQSTQFIFSPLEPVSVFHARLFRAVAVTAHAYAQYHKEAAAYDEQNEADVQLAAVQLAAFSITREI